MRRVLAAAVLLGVLLIQACGGGGSDGPDYDFNGLWTVSYVVSESNNSLVPKGKAMTGQAVIDQNGSDFVVTLGVAAPARGSCNQGKGSFSAQAIQSGIMTRINGRKEDGDTLSGDLEMTADPIMIRMAWTMQLASRTKPAPGPAPAPTPVPDPTPSTCSSNCAASGACSSHGGVNCSAGPDSDGSVICNDGWTGSSVSYVCR